MSLETQQETQQSAQKSLAPLPFRKVVLRSAGRIGLLLTVAPLRAMPLPLARLFGKGIGEALYRILGRYRRAALKNLNLIYGPQMTLAQRQQMARAVFHHFGQVAAEFAKLPQLKRAQVDRLAAVEGEENLRAAFEPGRGVLLITGHFGNWEFLGRWLTTHGYTLNVVARKANDPHADRLLNETRRGNGVQVYSRGASARAVLSSLRRNEMVALLPDQNAADVFVPFLGQQTGTVDGPGVIHRKTGAPLLFSWCERLEDGRFRITFEPPVVVPATTDRSTDVEAIMALINDRLGEQIRRNPTQWLWLHDRWKASPGVFSDGDEQARILKMASNRYKDEFLSNKDQAGR